MSLDIRTAFKSQLRNGRSHYLARCWRIELANKVPANSLQVNENVVPTVLIVRLTDWSEELLLQEHGYYNQLYTYTPMDGGGEATAKRRQNELETDNRQGRGFLNSALISPADLRAGRYEGALVDEYLVDTRTPWLGPIDHSKYRIIETNYDGQVWNFSLGSKVEKISIQHGDTFGPNCRVELFSQGVGKCNLSPIAFSVEFVVNSSLGFTTRSRIYSTTGSDIQSQAFPATGWFDDGTMYFINLPNGGLKRMIKSYVKPGVGLPVYFDLQEPLPFDVYPAGEGSTFHPRHVYVLPGCNKQAGINSAAGHCKNKFNNLVNFQGEPYIPGRDAATKGWPNASL